MQLLNRELKQGQWNSSRQRAVVRVLFLLEPMSRCKLCSKLARLETGQQLDQGRTQSWFHFCFSFIRFLRMSWGFKCVHDLFSMTVEKVDIIMIMMMILTHSWLSRGRVVSTSLQAAKLRLGEIIDEDHDLIWLKLWKWLSMVILILEILLLILYDGWLCYGNIWWSC